MPCGNNTEKAAFCLELSKYSSARLESFVSALKAVTGILIEAGQGKAKITDTTYDEIIDPEETTRRISPKSKKWYEKTSDNTYVLSNDTYINSGKTYYEKSTEHGFKEIVLSAIYDPAKDICPVCEGWYEDLRSYEKADKKLTQDTKVIPGKQYYKQNKYKAYTKVKIETVNPNQRGWYERMSMRGLSRYSDVTDTGSYSITSDTIIDYSKKYYEETNIDK